MPRSVFPLSLPIAVILAVATSVLPSATGALVASVRDGAWSEPQTWDAGRVPGAGDEVMVRPGTTVVYDVESDAVLRSLHVAGALDFARDRNTRLEVGDVVVSPMAGGGHGGAAVDDVDDVGHDHAPPPPATREARLTIGTQDSPVPHPFSATVRLHFLEGMDADASPAIVARPGGRLEIHGAPLARTWMKLGADVARGATSVTADGPLDGWRAGDEIVVTRGSTADHDAYDSLPESRTVAAIDGSRIGLDRPLDEPRPGSGPRRSEVANLSRNVVVESADPDGGRGHTMFHRHSAGSISYARFAHLGKSGRLGRYPIHFHLVRDSMRGSSVVGISVVDSHNRWVTIHGTQYLVVRDCIGYRSRGHGFFLEDATEAYNVLDRNLAIGALHVPPLPDQALPFDPNDGAGFWWANGKNSLVRNVSTANEKYGFRYDCRTTRHFDPTLSVRQPDGSMAKHDVRTIPVWRFEDNEAHNEGLYGLVIAANGEHQPDSPVRNADDLERIRALDWTGPPPHDPHRVRGLHIWDAHYAFRPHSPNMIAENVRIERSSYGIYRPAFENHVYRNLTLASIGAEPFNRGMDDASAQTGRITVDGLTVAHGHGNRSTPIVQLSDLNLSGDASSHFRNVTVERDDAHAGRWPLFNRGVGPRVAPITGGVPVYLHDHFGPGRHAKVVSTAADDLVAAGESYHQIPGITGDEAQAAEVEGIEWPELLDLTDSDPPATAITWPHHRAVVEVKDGTLTVRGTSTDNVQTRHVTVNGSAAQNADYHFHQWEATLTDIQPGPLTIEAGAEDESGNREQTPHKITVTVVAER